MRESGQQEQRVVLGSASASVALQISQAERAEGRPASHGTDGLTSLLLPAPSANGESSCVPGPWHRRCHAAWQVPYEGSAAGAWEPGSWVSRSQRAASSWEFVCPHNRETEEGEKGRV